MFILLSVIGRCICKSSRTPHWEHIAVDKVEVTALFGRDAVEIFEFADIVCRHPAVLSRRSIAVHSALVISAKQTLDIERHIVLGLFLRGEKGSADRLFPTDYPGVERVFHELKGLLLNIGKTRLLKVADHMRRHPENSSDFVYLKFSRFEELRLFGRNRNRSVFHSFLKDSDLSAVRRTSELTLPGFAHL